MFAEKSNLVFVILYAVEMCIKLLGLGFKEYFMSGFNMFDAILVVISLVELGISDSDTDLSAFLILRGLRVFRVIKLASMWKNL